MSIELKIETLTQTIEALEKRVDELLSEEKAHHTGSSRGSDPCSRIEDADERRRCRARRRSRMASRSLSPFDTEAHEFINKQNHYIDNDAIVIWMSEEGDTTYGQVVSYIEEDYMVRIWSNESGEWRETPIVIEIDLDRLTEIARLP